tara:strand:+ start:657 stop:1202 length:546 start_codon:yes stop_codon:yes gene_type:complete
MIKDISIIREELNGYAEVEMPYDFPVGCHIKYITMKGDEESFSKGGKFCSFCNDLIILENNGPTWSVPICIRNKCGNIIYQSKFFIPENTNEIIMMGGGKKKDPKELEDTIDYQQSIINKLIDRVKEVEIQKNELLEKNTSYEELLQEGRYKLKELAIEVKEKTNKLNHYEELIPKIYNSR